MSEPVDVEKERLRSAGLRTELEVLLERYELTEMLLELELADIHHARAASCDDHATAWGLTSIGGALEISALGIAEL